MNESIQKLIMKCLYRYSEITGKQKVSFRFIGVLKNV